MDYSIYPSVKGESNYIGISDNPERRPRYHDHESKGYTQQNRSWELVYSNKFESV